MDLQIYSKFAKIMRKRHLEYYFAISVTINLTRNDILATRQVQKRINCK